MTILKQSACSIAGLLLLLLLRCGLIEADDLSIRSMELSRRMFAPIIVVEYADFEGEFLVDTGATFTTVSGPKSLIENPKTNWTITTAGALTHGGARLIKQIHGVEVSAFGSPSTPTVLSFREELAKSNSTITAPHILGHREFDRLVIHFNLRLGICERTDQESIEKSATLLPIRDDETYPHAPSVAIDLPGFGSRNVIFDTGSYFFLTLKNERILQLKRAGILRNAGTLNGSSFGKLVQVRTFIIKSVEIGGYIFQNVEVLESEMETLGRGFMDCFDVFFDSSNRKIWLKPLETEWPRRIPPDASGLILSYRDTDLLLVVRMEPESAAIPSGLQEGDRVLSFDGKRLSVKVSFVFQRFRNLPEAGYSLVLLMNY